MAVNCSIAAGEKCLPSFLRSKLSVCVTDESGGVFLVADLFNERLIWSYESIVKVPAITAAWPKQELNASKIKEECGQIEIYGNPENFAAMTWCSLFSEGTLRVPDWE